MRVEEKGCEGGKEEREGGVKSKAEGGEVDLVVDDFVQLSKALGC